MSTHLDISRLWQEALSESRRTSAHPSERRSDRRYPIRAELEYRITRGRKLIASGRGQTIDISSAGVRFESSFALARGMKIDLCIDWPALASSRKRLELHAEGHTVRAERNYTAVQIRKYSFRGQHVQ